MRIGNPWQQLGIPATRDRRAIRVAYAKRLKAIDQEREPAAFQALRAAFEWALEQAELPEAAAPAVVWVPGGAGEEQGPEQEGRSPAGAPRGNRPQPGQLELPIGGARARMDQLELPIGDPAGGSGETAEAGETGAGGDSAPGGDDHDLDEDFEGDWPADTPFDEERDPYGPRPPLGRLVLDALPYRGPEPPRGEAVRGGSLDVAVAVADLMARLRGAWASGGEPAALAAWTSVAGDPRLATLLVRERFEEELVYWLARLDPMPAGLLQACDRTYRWREDRRHLGGLGERAPPAATVLRHLEAAAEISALEGRAAAFERGPRVLLKRHSALRSTWEALDADLFKAVGEELERLRWASPEALARLDPRQVAWWERRLHRPRLFFTHLLASGLFAMVMLAMLAEPLETSAKRVGEWLWAPAVVAAGVAGLATLYGLLWLGHLLSGQWNRSIGQAPWLQRLWAGYMVAWLLVLPFPTLFGVFGFLAYVLVIWIAIGSFGPRRNLAWLLVAVLYTVCAGLLLFWGGPAQHALAAAPGLALLVQWLETRPFTAPAWLRDGWLGLAAAGGLVLVSEPQAATIAVWMLLHAAVWSVLGGTFWPDGTKRPFIALTPAFLVVVGTGERPTPATFALLFLAAAAVRHAWLWHRSRRPVRPASVPA